MTHTCFSPYRLGYSKELGECYNISLKVLKESGREITIKTPHEEITIDPNDWINTGIPYEQKMRYSTPMKFVGNFPRRFLKSPQMSLL